MNANDVIRKYRDGQEIFRRASVGTLIKRIEELEAGDCQDASEYVRVGISKLFQNLAGMMGDHYARKLGAEMPAGALAFELMKAELYLLQKWDEFVRSQ